MIAGLDHVVILVEDLEAAVAEVSGVGFTVTPGGKHRDRHSRNALVVFSDGTYLELLAFTEPPASDDYFAERFHRGAGFADFALRSTDIDRDVEAMAAGGLSYPIPTHMAREWPDGQHASWRMSLPQALRPGTAYPFLMEDLTNRAIRVPVSPATTTHHNGAMGLAGISMVVEDLQAYHQSMQIILQNAPPDCARFRATRGIVQLPLTTDGQQMMAILQPTSDSAPERHFARFGNGIYAINLRAQPHDPMALGTGDLINLSSLGGARIYLQP